MDWLGLVSLALIGATLVATSYAWARNRGYQRRDIALALIPLFLLLVVQQSLAEGALLLTATIILVIAAPILFLRIVRHLEPVPPAVYIFTLVSTAVVAASTIWLNLDLRLAAAAWMAVVLAPYILAAVLLGGGARRHHGLGRRRLAWAAISGVTAAAIWIMHLTPALAPILLFDGVLVHGVFVFSYIWAFATPKGVREAWRAIAFQRFAAAIRAEGDASLDDLLERMRQAAAGLAEADAAFLLTRESDGGLAIIQDVPFPDDEDLAWRFMDAADGEPTILPGWVVIGLRAPEQPTRALAIRLSAQRLFPGEDEATLRAIAGEIRARFAEVVFRMVDRRSREAAEELARFRSEYLRAVAHEVANPLTPIKMQLAILRRRFAGQAPGPFQQIDKSLERIEALIRDVATIARLGSAGLELSIEDIDLSTMAADAAAAYVEVAKDGGCKVSTEIVPGMEVPADGLRIRQIIDNLLSNAIKYSPGGGTVSLVARIRGGVAEILVSDQGLGLTQEQREQLFSSYGRVHTDVAPQIQGTGMGLYIARQLARLHGGDLEAHSQGAGQGTRFKLSLPINGPPVVPQEAERPPLPGVRVRS